MDAAGKVKKSRGGQKLYTIMFGPFFSNYNISFLNLCSVYVTSLMFSMFTNCKCIMPLPYYR